VAGGKTKAWKKGFLKEKNHSCVIGSERLNKFEEGENMVETKMELKKSAL